MHRLPEDGQETASQPTLSRFENAIQITILFRLREWMVDQFLDSFKTPPTRLTFNLDGFDDPSHGNQQLTLFDGYHKQNQYFPLIITNREQKEPLRSRKCVNTSLYGSTKGSA